MNISCALKEIGRFFVWPYNDFSTWSQIWPLAVGAKTCRPFLHARQDDFHSFHYVACDKLELQIGDNKPVQLKKGDAFILWPGAVYKYGRSSRSNNRCMLFWIRISGPLTQAFFKAMGFSKSSFWRKLDNPRLIEEVIGQFAAIVRGYDFCSDAFAVSLLYRLLPGCNQNYVKQRVTISEAQRMREFMNSELASGYDVNEIAEIFNVSRHTFYKKFKAEFDLSPNVVLAQVRINRAKELLTSTKLKVEEVASLCGYQDPRSFFRFFKKKTGMTPTQYRESSSVNKLQDIDNTSHL